jgi:hypothetical protein
MNAALFGDEPLNSGNEPDGTTTEGVQKKYGPIFGEK